MKICSKCKVEKDIDAFSWKDKHRGIRNSQCKSCKAIYRKEYYQKNKEKEKARSKAYRENTIAWLQKYKDTLQCERCSEDFNQCLHFHHKNPEDKKMSISNMPHSGYSIESIKNEINKCIVLCANCHVKEHAGVG